MTLALTMGMTIGLVNTVKMMVGELSGVLLVATVVVVGGGSVIASNPLFLTVFKYLGGAYLCYLGLQMIRSLSSMAVQPDGSAAFELGFLKLAGQGFITAVANPKGWAFFLAILPAFINYEAELMPQMFALICIILVIELTSLMLYAASGQILGRVLLNGDNVALLNRFAGAFLMAVGLWLALN